MYNFRGFKGDTLYRLIPSGGIDLFSPRIVLRGIQYHGHRALPQPTCANFIFQLRVPQVEAPSAPWNGISSSLSPVHPQGRTVPYGLMIGRVLSAGTGFHWHCDGSPGSIPTRSIYSSLKTVLFSRPEIESTSE